MSDWATHTWCAYDAPSLHRPKAWAGEATKTRKQAVKSGALCPLLLSQLGPAQGANRGKALEIKELSVPRGGKGMAGAFQVWLAGPTNSPLAHAPPRDASRTS